MSIKLELDTDALRPLANLAVALDRMETELAKLSGSAAIWHSRKQRLLRCWG